MSIAYMGAGAIFYILMMLYCLAVLLPSLSLMVRRLHDIGKSGTYILMGLIPVVGYIFILVYMLTGSAPIISTALKSLSVISVVYIYC